MKKNLSIHWFRQDLRCHDNPALHAAIAAGTVIPIFIRDTQHAGEYDMGAASKWWLHHSLRALDAALGYTLSFYQGDPQVILPELVKRLGVTTVTWNRCYEPWRVQRDAQIKTALKDAGVTVISENSALLWEPWQVNKEDGTPYKVFTPFYRKGCLHADAPREPLPYPKEQAQYQKDEVGAVTLDTLNLLPTKSWQDNVAKCWQVGEEGAQQCLNQFIHHGLRRYKDGRNEPAKPYVSRLSPHLHFGEISPNEVWHTIRNLEQDAHTDHFCSELGWREFSYNLLYHNPDLPKKNLQSKFDAFPWNHNREHLRAWQKGLTGVPMVDAGMRELWQTGYMHNRVRMIVGSYLVKNLRIHWREGERWFWDCLVDADLANNSASWQWIAGCGADAAPYFRIFNPITQGQKFDPEGEYVRKYLPELSKLPNKFLFCPWEAPALVRQEAGVKLGEDYPFPVVDLKQSREEALAAFQSLKQGEA